ncbi:MAG TPA: GtrA family protein [Candidatus Sphingobacterium stercorigallinarum]|nr:GtrA family protein [Candidatus Sphingobacterium stercorigallinarum]
MSGRLREFIKAQLSAFLGGMTDLGIYTLCYTVLLYTAPVSNVISGSLGAVMNFVINRHWSFKVTERSVGSQLWKFIIVVIGSITLKTFGIYILVDCWFWHFLASKLIVELVVSLGFNFTLQKFWVFKK